MEYPKHKKALLVLLERFKVLAVLIREVLGLKVSVSNQIRKYLTPIEQL